MVQMKDLSSDVNSVYQMDVVMVRKMDWLWALSSVYRLDLMTVRLKELTMDLSLAEMKAGAMVTNSDWKTDYLKVRMTDCLSGSSSVQKMAELKVDLKGCS